MKLGKFQKENHCGNCGKEIEDWHGYEIIDTTTAINEYTCGFCGAEGRECYDLKFSEHWITPPDNSDKKENDHETADQGNTAKTPTAVRHGENAT